MNTESQKISIFLTNTCNLSCKHCFLQASPQKNDLLDWQDIKASLDFHYQKGYRIAEFTGGEACFSPHLKKAVEYAHKIGYPIVGINTNGTNPILFKQFTPQSVSKFIFSLDGATSQTHEYLRGATVFDRCINSIKKSVSLGFGTEVVFTVNSKNVGEVPQVIQLLDSLKVDKLSFNFTSSMGNAALNQDLLIKPQQWIDLRNQVLKNCLTKHLTIRFPLRFVTKSEYADLIKKEGYRCFLYQPIKTDVLPDKKIYHCCLLQGTSELSGGRILDGKIMLDRKNEEKFLDSHPKSSCPAEQYILKTDLQNPDILPVCVYYKIIIKPQSNTLQYYLQKVRHFLLN